MASPTGAQIIARSLRDIGVTVIFGIVGIPVVEIAEQAINLGIKFIGFRNEQAASYAASAYGYLTGRPGVCLVVGGPGVLHGIAGVSVCMSGAFTRLKLVLRLEMRTSTPSLFSFSLAPLKPTFFLAARSKNSTPSPSSLPTLSSLCGLPP